MAAAASPFTPLAVRFKASTSLTMNLQTAAGSCPMINSGSTWAALDLGSNTTSTHTATCLTYNGGGSYQLQTNIAWVATCSGTCATQYNVSAALKSASQAGLQWQIAGSNVTTTYSQCGGGCQHLTYGSTVSVQFKVQVQTPNAPPTIQQEFLIEAVDANTSSATAVATLNVEFINAPGISIFFTKDASGVAMTGGAFDAAVDFGTVEAYGSLPAGVSRGAVTTTYTVTTPIDINVEIGGVTSSNYTLQANLAAVAPTGLSYQVNSTTLSTTAATVTTTGSYNTAQAYTLGIVINTAAPGSGGPSINTVLTSTIDFTATAN
ncbi:MAG: hypothetical protein JO347_03470 [Candidatus Eremiobacteraeota bacterium]|nr:hypothetical protein [Candidatus Eremiobacteraeota bacterium]